MNELLWFAFALANFILFLGMYKLFGKTGIFVWVAISTIIANIQVTKNITLFGVEATLGNITYGTIFLATDALNEIYGKKSAQKAVLMGFYVMVATVVLMQMAIWFIPSTSDLNNDALRSIFGFFPRLLGASLTAFLISQFLDVHLFQKIREKLPSDKFLWVRNNGSTFISQLVDTAIFVPIAFLGVYSGSVLLQIGLTTYLIKVIVAMLDTPFLYICKRIIPFDNN
ncbi:MAG TPA: queuosine precursor transporter [Candidatus Izemoplasmatales bacterium]|nr:queuosine precursor transporter [Candidatus Izemoplasmatales bacterium]